MKVLVLTHLFLPSHGAGTELYTLQLARRLARRGHDVAVFTTDKDIAAPDLSLRRREVDGLPVTELVNNLFHERFRETWDHPRIAALFAAELDRLRPDVLHVQHLMYLSIGCVEEAARRGIPVLFTLHDYWLQCARFGQRVDADHALCAEIDPQRCGRCLARFKHAQTPLERAAGRVLAGVRGRTGLDLAPAARGAARLLGGGAAASGAPDPQRAAELADEVRARAEGFRERLVPKVALFLAPSRFLREQLVAWGLPAERVRYLRTGVELDAFGPAERAPPPRPRVLYVGSFAPHKGPHVLLEAWARLDPRLRGASELVLHGPARHHDAYREQLARRAAEVGATWGGPLRRDQVPDALRGATLLVVPSVWYENAPLVMLEALATCTPLLVSDAGGMAELVEPGVHGARFRMGDAEDLARQLERMLADPAALARLYPEGPVVHDVERAVDQVEALYREVLAGAPAPR